MAIVIVKILNLYWRRIWMVIFSPLRNLTSIYGGHPYSHITVIMIMVVVLRTI